jgi:hypothetical protein
MNYLENVLAQELTRCFGAEQPHAERIKESDSILAVDENGFR